MVYQGANSGDPQGDIPEMETGEKRWSFLRHCYPVFYRLWNAWTVLTVFRESCCCIRRLYAILNIYRCQGSKLLHRASLEDAGTRADTAIHTPENTKGLIPVLNIGYKKEALAEAERTAKKYQAEYDDTIGCTTELHGYKEAAVGILKDVDTYIHSLSNRPAELDKTMTQITVRRQAFEKEVDGLRIESKNADKISGGMAGVGMAAGAGVAAFGPTAAMAVATTFGTASTGTAIASLSGAAATNAALAWLGGGALAAGGGGMAAGQAFLAMAGPVGWAIGGAALVGGGLMASSKNKKIAEKAERQTREIKKEIDSLKRIQEKVKAEIGAITPLNTGVKDTLKKLTGISHRDYKRLSAEEKDMLMLLMNASESLSKRIGVKLS